MKHTYFILIPLLSSRAPLSLFYQDEKNQLRIGPHFRLAGLNGGAQLSSRQLAERARDALLPRFQKRYGLDTDIQIEEAWSNDPKSPAFTEKHSAIVQERLDKGLLAPNQKP